VTCQLQSKVLLVETVGSEGRVAVCSDPEVRMRVRLLFPPPPNSQAAPPGYPAP
jgi:hypothetical protein